MTKFAERVFIAARNIPRGKTLTYKEVAKRAGRPKAGRAVGNILNGNRDPKIPCHRVIRSDGKPGSAVGNILKKNFNPDIPCHRVIRSDGKLGGYNRGANKKRALLEKEGAKIAE